VKTPSSWDPDRLRLEAARLLAADPRRKALALLLHRDADALAAGLTALERDVPLAEAYRRVRVPPGAWLRANRGVLLALAVMALGAFVVALYVGTIHPSLWTKTRLPGLVVIASGQDYGRLGFGVDADGQPIVVAGRTYVQALGTHAESVIRLLADRDVRHVRGRCGYPDRQTRGQIVCNVMQNDAALWTSPPLSSEQRVADFDVAVDPTRPVVLRLASTTASIDYAHGAWLDLRGEP
jgi:hypothetical protein